ncbi:MAG: dienelactone hydrolase family protein [Clostridia bacterium]
MLRKKDTRIRSSEGGEFDCYIAAPMGGPKVPGIVLASAIHGVDKDLRAIADAFAEKGCVAAAPDLFWRTVPGPLKRDDPRSTPRGQPRAEKIKTGEQDLVDVLDAVRKEPLCNGRVAVIGFCYGGPYGIIGPKRLGYAAGIACHGTNMKDYLGELQGLAKPVCVLWGDKDHLAPPEVLNAYQDAAKRMKNLELHIFAGVEHGYMMRDAKAYNRMAHEFTMKRALNVVKRLR